MGYAGFDRGSLCCFVGDLNREDLLFPHEPKPSVYVFMAVFSVFVLSFSMWFFFDEF